jgi:hypothetical protein
MFDHPLFRKYDFLDVPLEQDIYLMDEKWMAEYDQALVAMFNGGTYANAGYISYAARAVSGSSIELSWYPNIADRFHEVHVLLPRDQFVTCVDCWEYDEKPRIFVKSAWLTNMHLRAYSVSAFVDAVGVKGDPRRSGRRVLVMTLVALSPTRLEFRRLPHVAVVTGASDYRASLLKAPRAGQAA